MLQLKNIKKDYVTASETVHALKGVDLSFRTKEFVSILGPSGCGKTTLLNIVGGLDKYTSGDLIINGKSTKSFKDRHWDVYRNHRVGFIFQSYNLIPHQTILGNVELALTIAGIDKEERIRRAKEALDKVGLAGQYYKRPNQLSGGQCQRVAIARALVNDPEILLADEPTGALDTVTSVQIMELVREIAEERLVIMVTHNPELADQYSTRIVRFRDGLVVEDTNPMTAEEIAAEEAADAKALAEEEVQVTKSSCGCAKTKKKSGKEKAKMSFFTAFRLSARNLLSKKGRTVMVGIAGSIGIVGIAMVLAFSAGIKGFVASMQDDMLSGNPIEISETGFDASAVSDLMGAKEAKDILKQPNKVYITSTVEKLAEMSESLNRLFAANTITHTYVDYVKAMPKSNYEAMLLKYGIDMSLNIYTDFSVSKDATVQNLSIKRLISNYTSILQETDYAQYSSFIPMLVPSMVQAPNNSDYILSQYDLLGESEVADDANEIMLVLNPDEEISDLLLAVFGYYTQEEFLAIVDKATADDPDNFDTKSIYREYFEYSELLGKTFTYYPADSVFAQTPTGTMLNGRYEYLSDGDDIADKSEGLELKVVGILTPKENVSYGSLAAGIYYTEALTNYILEKNSESEFIDYLESDLAEQDLIGRLQSPMFSSLPDAAKNSIGTYTFLYTYNYEYNGVESETPAFGMINTSSGMPSYVSAMLGMGAGTSAGGKDALIRNLGGNNLANNILIYPKSFDEKDLVTEYLDRWHGDDDLVVNGETIPASERVKVTYTDTLELIIDMINTMIDVITYALVAFTSISLVVSTVMIGIITYVSVVERIKEIGVIRSLGGRKKDVSHLFNAETFIIGLLAGLIGVGFTYFASVIVNAILKPLIGYAHIAALPLSQAVILVVLSVALTTISGLIPARSAAKKDPVVALRTE